jgi:hypothetical protein
VPPKIFFYGSAMQHIVKLVNETRAAFLAQKAGS